MKIEIGKDTGKEALVSSVFVGKEKEIQNKTLKELVSSNKFKAGDTKVFYTSERNFIVNFLDKGLTMRSLRILIRKIVQTAKQNRLEEIVLDLKNYLVDGVGVEDIARNIAENAILAEFDFSEFYKEKPKTGWTKIKTLKILTDEPNKISAAVKAGEIIGEETNSARFLSNSPAGDMTPESLAEAARKVGKKSGVKVTVFDEKKMKTLGMGGILGVGKGSEAKPRFIIMDYKGGKKGEKPLVLIGKGVTFDTGGINIKSSDGLTDMHLDMSGGASVIHAVSAIARLKLKINVIGLVPAVENMPSGSSYRPGDILKTYSGKTKYLYRSEYASYAVIFNST